MSQAAVRHPLAVNYAEALFNVARRRGAADALMAESRSIREVLAHDGGRLRGFLEGPQIPTDTKLGVVRKLLEGRADALTLNFVYLMIRRRRVQLLSEAFEALEDLVRQDKGIFRGEVVTAIPLNFNQRIEMEAALEKFTSSRLELEFSIDPEILGGVVFQSGDTLIDTSIRARLGELRRRLAGVRVI